MAKRVTSAAARCGCRASAFSSPAGRASSLRRSVTAPVRITSSPCFQFAGVATRCLAVELHRIDDAQHFVEVAARGHRVDQHELDLLVRADDEHVAHRLIVGRRAAFRCARGARRQHAVGLGHLQVGVADHRVVRRKPDHVLDVCRPLRVIVDWVDRQPDDLDAALVEFRLQPRHGAELGGADGREILGVREQHHPVAADPVVETNLAFGRFRFEIGGGVADLERHDKPPSWVPDAGILGNNAAKYITLGPLDY